MSQGVGATHSILGVQQTFGGMYWSPLDVSGSASYVAGGDAISPQSFGFNSVHLVACLAEYRRAATIAPNLGRSTADSRNGSWFGSSYRTGLQVGAAVNLSGETVRLAAIGQ